MNKPSIRIHDISTNIVIDREMTDAEYAVYLAEKESEAAQKELDAQKALDIAEAKAALLAKLGITADEAALLLG
jgi:hypothetical protein